MTFRNRTYAMLLASLTVLCCEAQKQVAATWASKDVHYARTAPQPQRLTNDTTINAWRGERLGVEALLFGKRDGQTVSLRLSGGKDKAAQAFVAGSSAQFLGYVTTDNYQYCGNHPTNLAAYDVPDVVTNQTSSKIGEGEARPVWCTVEVPRDAKPGIHRLQLCVADSASGRTLQTLTLNVNVNQRTLPTPKEQQFHVDFWQQPYALSRYIGTERWSDQHLEALRPYLRLLVRSGQKVVSAILFYEPWGDQSYDKFSPMVQTVRCADGSWAYDYTVFDKWVNLCAECGIDEQINCFSMVPWDMTFRYYDEAQGKDVDLRTSTGSEEYKELWTSFLQNFAAHLREKGWFNKTCIAMDERGLDNMLDAYRVAQAAVPGIKMALAGTYHAELVDKLHDYCIGFGEAFTADELARRKAMGGKSTTYTCCSNTEPNLFSNSLPAEAAYLPIFCIANGFEGYLHWSWMNWADKPLADSRFRLFAPGDTYLVYPDNCSSVRYERFIEGVALAEKVRILKDELRQKGDAAAAERLDSLVKSFAPAGIPQGRTASGMVNELHRMVDGF